MIISHAKKFVLLAPWKTASSTCHASLEQFNESSYSRFFHWSPQLSRVVHQHVTLADFLALPEGRLDYKVGAFVRNPYDRAYSGFLQLQRDFSKQPQLEYSPAWIGELVRAQIAENMSRVVQAGFDFNKWIHLLPDYEVYEPGRNTNMVLHPAHYWTHVDGKQRVGFVGKVESFDADFESFCEFAGIETPALSVANVSDVPDQSAVGGTKYAGRMSRAALDRINELFASDFEYFAYDRL
ncbi:MAG: sulfotransferase family 2 domain-containing protein [Sphingomonas sp.]|nr:sulfotransferase family 2 domain-containing protein [Sphingomonas sp.]